MAINLRLLAVVSTLSWITVSCSEAPAPATREKQPATQTDPDDKTPTGTKPKSKTPKSTDPVDEPISWLDEASGTPPSGFESVSLDGLKFVRDGKHIDVTQLLEDSGKSKAVIQIIDTLPGGSLCASCAQKSAEISKEINSDSNVSDDTVFLVVLSGDGFIPSDQMLRSLNTYLSSGAIGVKDLNGTFAQKFGSGFPPTVVINHQLHAKTLNMHVGQPSLVTSALDELSK